MGVLNSSENSSEELLAQKHVHLYQIKDLTILPEGK